MSKQKRNRGRRNIVIRTDGSGFTAPIGGVSEAQSTEPLFKGTLQEIKLIGKGVYMLPRHTYWTVNAYDGQRRANGEKHRVAIGTEETNREKALLKGKEFVEALKQQWIQKYGENGDNSTKVVAAGPPTGSIQQLMIERFDVLLAELGDGSTLRGYLVEGRTFLEILGTKRAHWFPARLTPKLIQRIVKIRLRRLNPDTNSPKQCLRSLRYVLQELPGFEKDWLKLIKAPQRKRGVNRPKLSDDFPFLIPEIKLMNDRLPEASDTAVGLYRFGSSGTMNPSDISTAKWQQFDEAVEDMAAGRRMKTNNPFYYGIWPELMAWLKKRKRKPGDIYIFPELVFSAEQLKNPLCNTKRLSREEEKATAIRTRTWTAFHDFLLLCGITRNGVSLRSFRSFNSSELFAAGYPLPLLKGVTGHSEDESFFDYVHILPRHICRLAEFHRRMYAAIVAGEEFPVYLTHTEVVEGLTSVAEKNQAEMKRFVTGSVDGLGRQIKTELGDFLMNAMNQMAAQLISAFCSALGGQVQPGSNGAVIFQLPRLILPENLRPAVVLPGPLANNQQLTLTFPNGNTQILN